MSDNTLIVRASTPGKVILFGEHSVVFGAPALAAAIGDGGRTTVDISRSEEQQLLFDFKSIGSELRIPLPLNLDAQPETDKTKMCAMLVVRNFQRIFKNFKGLNISVYSDLPVGAGLGSSASFSIALSAAFATIESKVSGDVIDTEQDGTVILSKDFLSDIKTIAYECEKIFHGNPSGIDTLVCTMGGIIKFEKHIGAEQIAKTLPLKIIVVDSQVPRETSVLCAQVKNLKESHARVANNILAAMREVTEAAEAEIRSPTAKSTQKLVELAEINHGLLYTLGVSHPKLEEIKLVLAGTGVGFKLTGAGGGGNAIVFIPPDVNTDNIVKLLKGNGFEKTVVVEAGGSGLRVQLF